MTRAQSGHTVIADFDRSDTGALAEGIFLSDGALAQAGADSVLALDANTSVVFSETDIRRIDDLFGLCRSN